MTDLNVIVLAGDRGPDDPLCIAASVPAKALVPIAGTPVLARVLDALETTFGAGGNRLVSGPARWALDSHPTLGRLFENHHWRWLEPGASPATSAAAAFEAADPGAPTLLTTGDHALLTPAILDAFLSGAANARKSAGADLAVGFVALERVQARFPGVRRTALRFHGGDVCTCNLFALMSPRAAAVLDLWRQVERDRKHPWRVVRILGFATLLRFLTRRLTLTGALDRLGRITGTKISPVMLDEPEAAVDVDSIADWQLVEGVVRERAAASRPLPSASLDQP